LIAETRDSGLPKSEIESITRSLGWLLDQSIGQAGRGLVTVLGDRSYEGERPKEFFTKCYELRSSLVHGEYPRPTRQEVEARVGSLELFVRDLLSVELLGELE
jgi:hypothetical protein